MGKGKRNPHYESQKEIVSVFQYNMINSEKIVKKRGGFIFKKRWIERKRRNNRNR